MNTTINKIITSSQGLDALALRLGAGVIFSAHGAQKLFGWFGGYGLDGTAAWMASIGLEPGMLMALAAGSAEFFGGIFLILGLLVRPSALVLAITMVVAIVSVHLQHGFFMSSNGYEFALALLAMSIALLFRGAGSIALDNVLASRLNHENTQ
jgi:putative oxidoreductase